MVFMGMDAITYCENSRDSVVSQAVCWKFVGTFLVVTIIGGATDI